MRKAELTDAQVEKEIERLLKSPHVKLAKRKNGSDSDGDSTSIS